MKLKTLVLCLMLLIGIGAQAALAQGIDIVPIQLGWTPDGRTAWLYSAIDKGWYEEEGMSIRVFRGFGAPATATNVDLGQYVFGINIDLFPIAQVRAAGGDLVVPMTLQARSPYGYQVLGRTLESPKDFEGLSIGVAPGSTDAVLFPLLAELNGADMSKVRVVNIGADAYVPAFLQRQVDLIGGHYSAVFQVLRNIAEQQNIPISAIWTRDWGIDIYGYQMVVKQKTIDENPDLVARFLRASKRGLDWAVANPDEAVDILLKYHPELDEKVTRMQWHAFIELTVDETTAEKGLGCSNPEKVAYSVKILEDLGLSFGGAQPEEIMNNQLATWCH